MGKSGGGGGEGRRAWVREGKGWLGGGGKGKGTGYLVGRDRRENHELFSCYFIFSLFPSHPPIPFRRRREEEREGDERGGEQASTKPPVRKERKRGGGERETGKEERRRERKFKRSVSLLRPRKWDDNVGRSYSETRSKENVRRVR